MFLDVVGGRHFNLDGTKFESKEKFERQNIRYKSAILLFTHTHARVSFFASAATSLARALNQEATKGLKLIFYFILGLASRLPACGQAYLKVREHALVNFEMLCEVVAARKRLVADGA